MKLITHLIYNLIIFFYHANARIKIINLIFFMCILCYKIIALTYLLFFLEVLINFILKFTICLSLVLLLTLLIILVNFLTVF